MKNYQQMFVEDIQNHGKSNMCLLNLVHIYFRFIYRRLFDFNMQKIEVEKWMANECGQAVDFLLLEEKSIHPRK